MKLNLAYKSAVKRLSFDVYLDGNSGCGGSPGGGIGIWAGGESLLSELVSSGAPPGRSPSKQLGTPRSSL